MIRQEQVFRSVTLPELELVAKAIVKLIPPLSVWMFYGEMGAGKTTLIKQVARQLQVTDTMSSPTFSIVNEYATQQRGRVYHFDFYRLKHEMEAVDIGTEEYFYSGDPCLVEWPEKIPSLFPPAYGVVEIILESESKRTIVISVHDGQEENRI